MVVELTSFEEPALPAPNWSCGIQKQVNVCRMTKITLRVLAESLGLDRSAWRGLVEDWMGRTPRH